MEVRDWQKDMELIEQYEHAKTLVHGWIPQAHGQDVPKEPVEEILKYWLQQYAAEKERADNLQEDLTDLEHRHLHLEEHSLKQKFKLEEEKQRADIAELAYRGLADDGVSRGEYESLLDKHSSMTKAYRGAEAREKKLREVIETAIEDINDEAFRTACNRLREALASLYPEEEEAK
ncbi:hypothetical protein [Paenibacillus macerans]|uniref:hypothetical protein n=1 Tax=Paenibacillus macerans TaxID=44252 RepID=UPI0020416F9D|nr:hypothetical protein [Paenibacillus macerans]MCM3703829.1 hypothetical protein [Paenibacillus macerans]